MTINTPSTTTLWDPLVRLFHWSLVAIFISNYFINEEGEDWHQWLGYIAVGWLVIRLVWGFIGPRAARWSDFFPTPKRIRSHLHAIGAGETVHRMGHSPLGALVMIAMLLCVAALGATGYMMEEIDYFWGEDWLEETHEWLANSLLALVILHVSAAIYVSSRVKENLVVSMITGRRQRITED